MSDVIIIALIAYLMGSIPFGIVLARLFGLPDPRTMGSGNIGATNMLRTGNKKVALLTLLLDAGKGVAAVLLAMQLSGLPSLHAFALLLAAVGHMYSPWLRFTGGKGVATILGGLFALSPWLGLAFAAVWLSVFLVTRYVSLASIVALWAVPMLLFAAEQLALTSLPASLAPLLYTTAPLILAMAAAIAIYKHRANILRLRDGTEPKMGGKRAA